MTDRELLELAAKAAGMTVFPEGSPWPDGDGWFFCVQHGAPGMHFRSGDQRAHRVGPWLPLTDDGDALRLAVKLHLVIQHAPKYVVVLDCDRDIAEHEDNRENGGDANAATRRAIVRAAAEIGKNKEQA